MSNIINTAKQIVGPFGVYSPGGVFCMRGEMTAGFVTLAYQPSGADADAYFVCDEIDVERFQHARDADGVGYGFCAEIILPRGGNMQAMSSSDFVGEVEIFIGAGN